MDDSCAVCANALEWVAYGPCGHRNVCSTRVVRLGFVLEDSRCCICKTNCPSVFVTKRHNAMEHGRRMSRAQRNAAFQIPTSFIYRRNEQDQRRGRGRGRNAYHDGPDMDISSSLQNGSATADHGLASRVDNVTGPLQSNYEVVHVEIDPLRNCEMEL